MDDRKKLFAVAQLMSAATAMELAYRIIENIPSSSVLNLKIDISKKVREIKDLTERAIALAKEIDDTLQAD